MYSNGLGVKKVYAEAYRWAKLSDEWGDHKTGQLCALLERALAERQTGSVINEQ